MPRSITQYRVFIASPSGLDAERKAFRETLERYTACDAEPRGVTFYPVGWEDTIGGVGRPQEQINEDLKQCDYAVFLFHDRWGSPTGSGHSSGVEEEWKLAEELYAATTIRNIGLFFKKVDERQLKDPGEQLKKVLEFKAAIASVKKHLFRDYEETNQFCDHLRFHLAKWLRDHEGKATGPGLTALVIESLAEAGKPAPARAPQEPGFDYWIMRADLVIKSESPQARDYAGALFCTEQALATAESDVQWARAKNAWGTAKFGVNEASQAFTAFSEIADRFSTASDLDRRTWAARALVNKGFTLGTLDRSEEEIGVYDDVVARYGAATEPALREQVAKALVNKGVALETRYRSDEAIGVYDDVVARFDAATELALREQVAKALVNKGVMLGTLDRSEEAIGVFDEAVARFGAAAELALRESVAIALVNKGIVLGTLSRSGEAIGVYDDVVARFGAATEPALREQVAKALVGKGSTLGTLGRSEEAIRVYNDVVARFGAAIEPALREQVAVALVNKGVVLGNLNRSEEEIGVYDDVVARFGAATEPALREQVAKALVYKGITLETLDRSKEAIGVYDEVIARFGEAEEPELKDLVDRARTLRKEQKRKPRPKR